MIDTIEFVLVTPSTYSDYNRQIGSWYHSLDRIRSMVQDRIQNTRVRVQKADLKAFLILMTSLKYKYVRPYTEYNFYQVESTVFSIDVKRSKIVPTDQLIGDLFERRKANEASFRDSYRTNQLPLSRRVFDYFNR